MQRITGKVYSGMVVNYRAEYAHIYTHGNKDMIEKGYDDDKSMNFYKVYFRQEE